MANALADETSPYLLQHKDNPVDWRPWGEAALARARELDRPLLVSIGYSACHWCHVMERECFENDAIAALMNEHFVCVKVDREERPDVDAIYMEAVQAMTGSGGWPLNVFITPEQVPFYAGTYYPPEPRHGMPSWPVVLQAVAQAWDTQRDEIRAQNDAMAARLSGAARLRPADGPLNAAILDDAVAAAARAVRLGQRRLGRRAEVPRRLDDRVPAAPRRDADVALHAALDGLGRDQRPDRRRLRALRHRRRLDGPALREDALRQRAAGARLPARLAGQRRGGGWRSDPQAHRRGDARLGAARDDRARGRVPQRAGRRLRGRRGQVLRLERWASCAPSSATTPTRRSPGSAPASRATSRARTSSSRAAPSRRRRCASASARRCWRRATSASGRAWTTSA